MEQTVSRTGLSAERLARIAPKLKREFIESGRIAGCQVLVARRGEVALRASLGQMDREREQPMRDDAIFRIYSMTKPVTSVALMQLYERGAFQLSDPVHRVIPEWRGLQVYAEDAEGRPCPTPAPRAMTFRHVLTHMSGLTYAGFPETGSPLHPLDAAYRKARVGSRKDNLRTMVGKLAELPLRYTPGERWLYSYASDVCGHLVEVLSGQRLDAYLEEHIFAPLGMRDTSFTIQRDKLSRLTACYERRREGGLRLIDDPQNSAYLREPTFFSGGHGLLSTLSDYLRFCEMLRRGGELDGARILGPRTVRLMTRNHLPQGRDLQSVALEGFSETSYEGVGFGLGFATTLDEAAAGTFGAGDFYWSGLASTLFWVDPREDLVVLFLTQLVPSGSFNFRGLLKSLVYSAIVD